MAKQLSDLMKTDDWKTEKHVPAIDAPESVAAGEMFDVRAAVGAEVDHPNTTEHHIRWISLYYLPEGGKQVYQVATTEFTAHGESVDGPNQGPVYTHHGTTARLKITKPGTLLAMSYCNIHGLWQNSRPIRVS
jgi:superoxide reductase